MVVMCVMRLQSRVNKCSHSRAGRVTEGSGMSGCHFCCKQCLEGHCKGLGRLGVWTELAELACRQGARDERRDDKPKEGGSLPVARGGPCTRCNPEARV